MGAVFDLVPSHLKSLCYLGQNMHYRSEDWNGTISFWMRLDPDKDLQPGYCDPLQVTQFAWNNGSFFVDFDKDLPRDFRLGVFSDLKFWNPENIDWKSCRRKTPDGDRQEATVLAKGVDPCRVYLERHQFQKWESRPTPRFT